MSHKIYIALIRRLIEALIGAYHKTIKTARTISDLAGCAQIQSERAAEAIPYRSLDRQGYG